MSQMAQVAEPPAARPVVPEEREEHEELEQGGSTASGSEAGPDAADADAVRGTDHGAASSMATHELRNRCALQTRRPRARRARALTSLCGVLAASRRCDQIDKVTRAQRRNRGTRARTSVPPRSWARTTIVCGSRPLAHRRQVIARRACTCARHPAE